MENAQVTFVLPGKAYELLLDGSPGDVVEKALRDAVVVQHYRGLDRPAGRRVHFCVDEETANAIADYLDSVAGAVGEMSGAEREGGREHLVARDAVRRIEEALQ